MAIVDQEGRLFGVNLFDAVAALVVLAMLALGVIAYRLLHVPAAPTILAITPSTLTSGTDLRVVVTGDNLLPYLRAYLQRTRKPAAVMHDLNPMTMFDNYTLVNYTAARLLIESPQLAEVRLPDNLLPGTYDFVLQNEANIVAVREAAVTIAPPPPSKTARATDPEATIRVQGVFRALTEDAARRLTAGLKLPYESSEPWGEILSVKPPVPDEARLEAGERSFVAPMVTRWQVTAELRLRCSVSGPKCYLPNAVLLEPGHNVSIDAIGKPYPFLVTDLLPLERERQTTATATMRFVGRTETLALIHERDADVSPGGERQSPGRIAAVQKRGALADESVVAFQEGTVRIPDKVGFVECSAVFPVIKAPTGWWYRGQPIKAGASITFQTDSYIVRGTITAVTFSTQ